MRTSRAARRSSLRCLELFPGQAEVAARSAELDRRERELKARHVARGEGVREERWVCEAREEAVQRREQALDLPTFPERGVVRVLGTSGKTCSERTLCFGCAQAAETPTPSRAPCALFQAC